MSKKINIGLFGFGCVGQGLYHVLNNSTGFKADIIKIGVKDRNKERIVNKNLITYDKWEILNDPAIDVIVELIDDEKEAYTIVSEALKRGKHVVTANKKLLALHLEELYALQQQHNVSLLYEGAVCASIPIIRTLEEYFDNEELEKLSGIFNGTTNYILTKTIKENLSYETALAQAQEKGFAETDPTSDVQAFDPKYKAAILALHGFGLMVDPEKVLNIGITTLHENDIRYASEKSYNIKLTPIIQRVSEHEIGIIIAPQFVKEGHHLFHVENEFNGVIVEGVFSGEQFLQGKGAGSYPTGAAVLSDISALSHGYKYEYKKLAQTHQVRFTNTISVTAYLRYNTVLDLEQIPFEEVYETYNGHGYHYTIGRINIQTLLDQKAYISKNNLFIALVNDQLTLSTESVITEKQTITIN